MQDVPEVSSKQPNLYINTGKATLLAIFKLFEALIGCVALYFIFTASDVIEEILNALFDGLVSQASTSSPLFSFFSLLSSFSSFFLVFETFLVILDGFGTFFVRVAHRGASLVCFCHRFRFICSVISFVLCLFLIFEYMIALSRISLLSIGDFFTFMRGYELILSLIIFVGAFWLYIEYDHYVAKIMKQVSIDIKNNAIQPWHSKNRLGRESAWFCGLFAVSAVLSIIEIIGGDSILSIVASIIKPIEFLYSFSTPTSIAIMLLLSLRFFLVNRCSKDFDKAHQSS